MDAPFTASAARRLDYWDERGLVSPSVRKAKGKGSERQYSFKDLVKLSVVKGLRDAGLSLSRIQTAIKILKKRRVGDPLADICLIPDGRTVVVRTKDRNTLEDVLQKGQLVFTVVATGEIEAKVTLAVERYNARVATG